jgi:hypothetical protein
MKRAAPALLIVALLAAHVAYWYVPRERAVAPPPLPAVAAPGGRAPAAQRGGKVAPRVGAAVAPLQLLAADAYDVCVWVPYPHQNLGVLASAAGDLQEVIAAAARLSGGEGSPASKEPEESPTFGPFEVPPASEMAACSDLAGGRLRVVARIYPALAAVAKLAGRLADNPWLAGGAAGRARIAWSGRLWSVTAGEEAPPPGPPSPGPVPAGQPPPLGSPSPGPVPPSGPIPLPAPAAPSATGPQAPGGSPSLPASPAAAAVQLPESLAVVRWRGARPEIPAGYYALTRSGSDLLVSLVGGAGGTAGAGATSPVAPAALAALLVAVGPEWRGGGLLGAGPRGGDSLGTVDTPAAGDRLDVGGRLGTGGRLGAGGPRAGTVSGGTLGPGDAPKPAGVGGAGPGAPPVPAAPLPPAALALFETGGSRLSSLGDLPGLAVFNLPGPAGSERWPLPTEGVFRLLAHRLPAADLSGWRIVALDPGSLRQAEAIAPRLAALMLPSGAGPAAGGLSLGVWLEPRPALRLVSRIRRFVDEFPLASRRQVGLWRDWETVLDPLANCDHASLVATASPPSLRLRLQGCTASPPR